MSRFVSVLTAALLLTAATAANAQLAGLKHILTVPGWMNTFGGIGTFITCTNGNTGDATVGVEFYSEAGAYLDGSSFTIPPLRTRMWGSRESDFQLFENVTYPLPFTKGHARIVADVGGKIVCSAILFDATDPGGFMASLPVVKKFTQK